MTGGARSWRERVPRIWGGETPPLRLYVTLLDLGAPQ
jgi:hypothetical protein